MFDSPRLAQFIGRVPKFKSFNEARMCFDIGSASVKVVSLSKATTNASLLLESWHGQPGFQLSPLVQLCTSSILQALIPTVEHLAIFGTTFSRVPWQDPIALRLWRELLQPFAAVKDLYVGTKIAPHIVIFRQELVEESVLELFPVLQNIFLDKSPEGIEQFVAARELANRPISVSPLEIKLSLDCKWAFSLV